MGRLVAVGENGSGSRQRMAVVEEARWAPPGTQPAMSPQLSDRDPFSKGLGVELKFSEFIAGSKWNVDDVLRPIYEDAGEAMGRESRNSRTSESEAGTR